MALSAADARSTFELTHAAIYQIRVIDIAANNKTSTGSGFVIDSNGLIATNYHVVSNAVNTPSKYRIELLQKDESKVYIATVENVDVVNDLALLHVKELQGPVLPLARTTMAQGDTAYAIGYPYDLGITVVPGTYNGLAPHSASDRVHFTGSLNPGMSGGPAFNSLGEVIGINVASAGNQVSFLIPVERLQSLYAGTPLGQERDLKDTMRQQLVDNSTRMIDQMLNGNWRLVPLGRAQALDEITGFLRCWGDSKNQQEQLDNKPFWAQRSCQTDHNIFVSPSLMTGKIELQFYWLESEELNSAQFYEHYEQIFSRFVPGNSGREEDLGRWACEDAFVNPAAEVTKAVFCARGYDAMAGLYDVLFLQGSVSRANEAHIIHFTLAGTTRELAQKFTQRFIETGAW
ncbi:MAG: hypothetical protein CMP86_14895 [Gammaproteobacteria bacterium]|nr:hypothetical protein [Gammaproteobacteria bacterium]